MGGCAWRCFLRSLTSAAKIVPLGNTCGKPICNVKAKAEVWDEKRWVFWEKMWSLAFSGASKMINQHNAQKPLDSQTLLQTTPPSVFACLGRLAMARRRLQRQGLVARLRCPGDEGRREDAVLPELFPCGTTCTVGCSTREDWLSGWKLLLFLGGHLMKVLVQKTFGRVHLGRWVFHVFAEDDQMVVRYTSVVSGASAVSPGTCGRSRAASGSCGSLLVWGERVDSGRCPKSCHCWCLASWGADEAGDFWWCLETSRCGRC